MSSPSMSAQGTGSGTRGREAITPGRAYGFFTDTTLCIGCKACEVACKQWNNLPADGFHFTGVSYDNTRDLSATTWRHVVFVEQFDESRFESWGEPSAEFEPWGNLTTSEQWAKPGQRWLFMSDVCKHCVNAPCLEVCPTGAIIRTEFDSVYIQEPACNGCRNCVAACPFGVIHMAGPENEGAGTAKKCTLCYDRLQNNLVPACAQACPTESIQFGPIDELRARAEARVQQLQSEGFAGARLYGADESVLGGLNAFYLLLDEPAVYGLPSNPLLPSRAVPPSSFFSIITALIMGLAAFLSFRNRREDKDEEPVEEPAPAAD